MILQQALVEGAFIVTPEIRSDERGFFSRIWCEQEFSAAGLNVRWVQSNLSGNAKLGTLRGMHYQLAPYAETKLVGCTAGRIYDVVVDLREGSSTYLKHFGVELSAKNRTMVLVPEGCAHGFETLEDQTDVLYMMSAFYAPESARGVRWDDPGFKIQWPIVPRYISRRDQEYPDYSATQ